MYKKVGINQNPSNTNSSNANPCVNRGGNYNNSNNYTANRNNNNATNANNNVGFRLSSNIIRDYMFYGIYTVRY